MKMIARNRFNASLMLCGAMVVTASTFAGGGDVRTENRLEAGESEQPVDLFAPQQDERVKPFLARLAALRPTDLDAYFRLAEELADISGSAEARRLAEQLFALCAVIDLARDTRSPLAASSCMALAKMRGAENDRQWLVALARQIDPRQVPPAWSATKAAPSAESEAFRAVTAMGLARAGEGAMARQLLDKPEVRDTLARTERVLIRYGFAGGLGRIVRDAERWPCSECGNKRLSRRAVGGGKYENKLCLTCDGLPGPKLNARELLAQLRYESWLLQGEQRSWSSQLTADQGTPIIDPDPAALPVVFGVSVDRPCWKNGTWVQSPDKPTLPAAAPQPK